MPRRAAAPILYSALVLVTTLFGVRVEYSRPTYWLLVVLQLAVVAAPTARMALHEWGATDDSRRLRAAGSILLISPWIVFAPLAGFGPPWQSTAVENQVRYFALIVAAVFVTLGFFALREALAAAGERVHATFGLAASALGGAMYLVWGAMLLYLWSARVRLAAAPLPAGAPMLSDLSDVLLFLGGALTYGATAAFATACGRLHWIGLKASRIVAAISLLAFTFLVIRGVQFPDPAVAFTRWYEIPGFVAGIPAIPWMPPCVLGVVLLSRARA